MDQANGLTTAGAQLKDDPTRRTNIRATKVLLPKAVLFKTRQRLMKPASKSFIKISHTQMVINS